MVGKPTPEQISMMWWRHMSTGKIMVINAKLPSGEYIAGDVISRGSMMRVRDHETGEWWEDVKSEWVISATLIFPRSKG